MCRGASQWCVGGGFHCRVSSQEARPARCCVAPPQVSSRDWRSTPPFEGCPTITCTIPLLPRATWTASAFSAQFFRSSSATSIVNTPPSLTPSLLLSSTPHKGRCQRLVKSLCLCSWVFASRFPNTPRPQSNVQKRPNGFNADIPGLGTVVAIGSAIAQRRFVAISIVGKRARVSAARARVRRARIVAICRRHAFGVDVTDRVRRPPQILAIDCITCTDATARTRLAIEQGTWASASRSWWRRSTSRREACGCSRQRRSTSRREACGCSRQGTSRCGSLASHRFFAPIGCFL
jgi:hypothetical protein